MGNISKTNPSRFFQLAIGKFDNFTHKTDGLIALGDTTPDVSLYSLLYADTTGALDITYFDNPSEGQIVWLLNAGSGEVSFTGAQIYGSTSSPIEIHDSISFIHHNSSWYELYRSSNTRPEYLEVPVAASSSIAPCVIGRTVLNINSAGVTVLNALSDGHPGQVISIINEGKGDVYIRSGSGGTVGTFVHGSGLQIVMAASDSTMAICNGTNWFIPDTTVAPA